MANRISQLVGAGATAFVDYSVFEAEGYKATDGLSSSILRYAVRSVLGHLEERVEAIEEQVAVLKEELAKHQEKWGELERQTIRVKTLLTGAMALVKLFAFQRTHMLDTVSLGWADNEYRFVFVTKTENFDWEFSDSLAELEAALVQDYADLKLSCKCIPLSVQMDLNAILQHKLAQLDLPKENPPEKTSDAVSR